jgi:hypothetical protein
VVTPKQLGAAVDRTPPGDGGVLIPVGRPGGDLKPSTPAPTVTPWGPVDPRSFQTPQGWSNYVARAPFHPDWYSRLDQGENRLDDGSQFQRGYSTRDGFDSEPRSTRLMPALVTPEPAAAPKPKPKSTPDKTAFTATDSVYNGVDTSYVKTPAAPEAESKAPKSGHRLKLNYGGLGHGERTDKPVTPKYKDLDAYVNKLLHRKKDLSEFLQRLANSTAERDRRVLNRMAAIEFEQGGIGKKLNIESFPG